MSENVTLETFKIWTNSQDRLLDRHSKDIIAIALEQKEIHKQLVEIVGLFKQDINTTKNMIELHIVEYAKDREQIDIRFTNLFKRQDKIDKILLQRQSMWMVFKGLSWMAKLFIGSVTVAIAASLVKLAFM